MRKSHLALGVAAFIVATVIATALANAQDAKESAATQTDRTTDATITTTQPRKSVTPEEIRMAAIDVSDAAFRKLDVDGDGRISALEANADPKVGAAFLDGDKNKDGFLSREEFKNLRSATSTVSEADAASATPAPKQ